MLLTSTQLNAHTQEKRTWKKIPSLHMGRRKQVWRRAIQPYNNKAGKSNIIQTLYFQYDKYTYDLGHKFT